LCCREGNEPTLKAVNALSCLSVTAPPPCAPRCRAPMRLRPHTSQAVACSGAPRSLRRQKATPHDRTGPTPNVSSGTPTNSPGACERASSFLTHQLKAWVSRRALTSCTRRSQRAARPSPAPSGRTRHGLSGDSHLELADRLPRLGQRRVQLRPLRVVELVAVDDHRDLETSGRSVGSSSSNRPPWTCALRTRIAPILVLL